MFFFDGVCRCKSIRGLDFEQIAAQISTRPVRLAPHRHVLRVKILVETAVVAWVDKSIVDKLALLSANVDDPTVI